MNKLNLCEAGHTEHSIVKTETIIGPMMAFEWDKYKGFKGYCSGQDDISRTLIDTGVWEPTETKIVQEILKNGDRSKEVIDVGAHTGWYSLMAAKEGYQVVSVEADPENIRLLKLNGALNNIPMFATKAPEITVYDIWIDKDTKPLNIPFECELLIIDIEGNDMYAVEMYKKSFEHGTIANAMIEISPCFNDRYPDMVNYILSKGYRAWYVEESLREFDNDYTTPQFNLLFTKE